MSRHQAYRNVASTVNEHLLDDDDYSDADAEELGAEDKALMEQGTADIREALGVEASKVTTEQIQEALWHYYYDVDKSVTYLITKFIAPAPPKAAKPAQKGNPSGKHPFSYSAKVTSGPVVRFCPGASAHSNSKSAHSWICGPSSSTPYRRPCGFCNLRGHGAKGRGSSLIRSQGHEFSPTFDISRSQTDHSLSALFKDMPWGSIPQDRVTIFVEPPRARGGLLGGSGAAPKMTKLQQLALARKKKLEQQQSSEEQTEDTRQRLGELSVKEAPPLKENRSPEGGGYSKRQKLSETQAVGRMLPLNSIPDKAAAAKQMSNYKGSESQDETAVDPAYDTSAPASTLPSSFNLKLPGSAVDGPIQAPDMAQPSAFAQTLFGASSVEPEPPATKFFALPYMAYNPSLADAFAEPSPDDVVMAAQAKGSLTGKGKN